MKFSSQEEYGLRCLMQLAQRGPTGSLTIPEMSRLEGLSATHVAKILMILRKEGFITSTRGQIGGYQLSRPAETIFVSDVLVALGGKLYDADFCGRHTGQLEVCTHAVDCSVRGLWDRVQRAVDLALDGLSLADLLERRHESVANVTLMQRPQRMRTEGKG